MSGPADACAALAAAGLAPEALERVRAAARETLEPVPVIVSRLGLLPDDLALAALSNAFGWPVAGEEEIPEAAPDLPLNPDFLRARRALPLSADAGCVRLALVDPESPDAAAGVAFAAGRKVEPALIGFDAWRRGFERLYGGGSEEAGAGGGRRGARWTDDAAGLKDLALDAPAVRLAESLVAEAVEAGASDIHVERKPDGGLVRLRVDGRLRDHRRLAPRLADALVARLKVLGDLDVADHRRAQDGRTSVSARGRPVDVRLSIIPSAYGEGAVVRLLHRADMALDFPALGFSGAEAARIREAIARPQGFYLVAGPTGGGKTTTLYAALNILRAPERKIVTVEDPIEYFFEDVHQTAIDPRAGLGFAEALRAFLRHDPDVVLVGEIRDADTAGTAVQAALTGHLVLSTLHAAEAAGAPPRLMEMGVEPYLLAATLTAASAQRLVRRLCPSCAAPAPVPQALLERAGLTAPEDAAFREARGCPACRDGYRGRMVISETLPFDEAARALVRERAGPEAFRALIERPLLADGLLKAAAGLTPVSEVLRALEAA